MKEDIKETRLENGLVILTDRMPNVRSVTLGFFFRMGSRHEPDHLNGITHFIEHAVFKGTNRRSALDIAIEQDRLGGTLEAFTTHEETGFAIKVIDEQLEEAFDLVADMLSRPEFDAEELKNERRVIIEELKMTEDTPEDHLSEIFSRAFYPNHPLGLSIAGTPKSVRTFDHTISRKYHRRMFHPANLVIVAAGNVEHKSFVSLCRAQLRSDRKPFRIPRSVFRVPRPAAPILVRQQRELEQAHLILATPFISGRQMKRYAADLLATVLGTGASSRLWQKIREERGLAYSVGSSALMFADCGMFMVAAATSPEHTREVANITLAEMRDVVANGVTPNELEVAKQQTRATILLSLEDSASRAAALAQSEMLHGRQITVEESLANTDAVTLDEVRDLAREFFRTENVAFAALGDLKGFKMNRKQLSI